MFENESHYYSPISYDNSKLKEKVTPQAFESIRKRNHAVLHYYRDILKVPISLYGDSASPAVIFDNQLSLSISIRDYNLFYLTQFYANPFYAVDVSKQEISREALIALFQVKVRPIWRIRLEYGGTELYLCDWQYEGNRRGPMFGTARMKIYHEYDHCAGLQEELLKAGYNTSLVIGNSKSFIEGRDICGASQLPDPVVDETIPFKKNTTVTRFNNVPARDNHT